MFLYMKTNILRGLGIFKIDFPVVTNQLIYGVESVHRFQPIFGEPATCYIVSAGMLLHTNILTSLPS